MSNAERIQNAIDDTTKKSQELTSQIDAVQSVLNSQMTGKSISVEDFNSDELADYRSALEYVNGTMQLNADKVTEIAKAKADEQVAINNTNGTEIHATLNGNNYITDDEVNIEILSDDNLSSVNIGGVDYKDMTCTNIWSEDGHTRFIIREMTEAEKMKQCIIELSALL